MLQLWMKPHSQCRGCVKWKEAKALLTKRTSVERIKGAGAPSLPAAPKENCEGPSAESLGPGWNNAVRGGSVLRVIPQLIPNQLPDRSLKHLHEVKQKTPVRKARL